jgi:hypothetical protein
VSSVGPGEADVPLWIKIAYTLFVCVLVPVYVRHYGPANFLWFSDVALLVMVPVLWIESRLVASMMALAVVLPELAWNLDFFGRLLTGRHLLGLSLHSSRTRPSCSVGCRSSTCSCRFCCSGCSSRWDTTHELSWRKPFSVSPARPHLCAHGSVEEHQLGIRSRLGATGPNSTSGLPGCRNRPLPHVSLGRPINCFGGPF